MKKITTASLCFLLFIGFPSQANITVYPMAVGLDIKGEGSVRLLSKSPEVQFVRTKLLKIVNPGTPEEKEVEVDPGNGNDLVVMPPKFAIPGGSSKIVRFVSMSTPDKEELYRVMFESVPSLDDAATTDENKKITSDVSVNLVWGILVTVPPLHPVIDISLTPDHKKLQNKGTQRVKITDIGLCQRGKKDIECQWQKDNKNLFPDRQYNLPSTSGYQTVVVKYKNWMNKKTTRVEFTVN